MAKGSKGSKGTVSSKSTPKSTAKVAAKAAELPGKGSAKLVDFLAQAREGSKGK